MILDHTGKRFRRAIGFLPVLVAETDRGVGSESLCLVGSDRIDVELPEEDEQQTTTIEAKR
jgi:hypothetical protein